MPKPFEAGRPRQSAFSKESFTALEEKQKRETDSLVAGAYGEALKENKRFDLQKEHKKNAAEIASLRQEEIDEQTVSALQYGNPKVNSEHSSDVDELPNLTDVVEKNVATPLIEEEDEESLGAITDLPTNNHQYNESSKKESTEVMPDVAPDTNVDMKDVPGYEAFRAERVRAREEKNRAESAYNTAYTEHFAELKVKRDAGGLAGYWKNKIADTFGITPKIPDSIQQLHTASDEANKNYIDATRAYHGERRAHAVGPVKAETETLRTLADRFSQKDALFEATVAGRSVIDVIRGRKDVQAQALDALTEDPKLRARIKKITDWAKNNPNATKAIGAVAVTAGLTLAASTVIPAIAAMGAGLLVRTGVLKAGNLLWVDKMKARQEIGLSGAKLSVFGNTLSKIEEEYDKNQKSIDLARRTTKVTATGLGIAAGAGVGATVIGSESVMNPLNTVQDASREAVGKATEAARFAAADGLEYMADAVRPEVGVSGNAEAYVPTEVAEAPAVVSDLPAEVQDVARLSEIKATTEWMNASPAERLQIEEVVGKTHEQMQAMADALPTEVAPAPAGVIEAVPTPVDHVIEKGNNLWRIITGEQVGRDMPVSLANLSEVEQNQAISKFLAHLDANDGILKQIGIESGNPSIINVGDHINLTELDKALSEFMQSEAAKNPITQAQMDAPNYPNGTPQSPVMPAPVEVAPAPFDSITNSFDRMLNPDGVVDAVPAPVEVAPTIPNAQFQGFESMSPQAQQLIDKVDPPKSSLFGNTPPTRTFDIMQNIQVSSIVDTVRSGGKFDGITGESLYRYMDFIGQPTPSEENMTFGQLIDSRAGGVVPGLENTPDVAPAQSVSPEAYVNPNLEGLPVAEQSVIQALETLPRKTFLGIPYGEVISTNGEGFTAMKNIPITFLLETAQNNQVVEGVNTAVFDKYISWIGSPSADDMSKTLGEVIQARTGVK